MKALYKYPLSLNIRMNGWFTTTRGRSRTETELELVDTGVFDRNRYFDVLVEYAKETPTISSFGEGRESGPALATLHVLPTICFETLGRGLSARRLLAQTRMSLGTDQVVRMSHQTLGDFLFAADHGPDGKPPTGCLQKTNPILVTSRSQSGGPLLQGRLHDYIVGRKKEAVNPEQRGTKAAAAYKVVLKAGEETVLKLRLWSATEPAGQLFGSSIRSGDRGSPPRSQRIL